MMKRCKALLGLALALLLAAQPAYAQTYIPSSNPVGTGGAISVDASPTAGTPVLLHNVPGAATCAWKVNAVANGSTSCISYTPSPSDVTKTLSVDVKLPSGTVASGTSGTVGTVSAVVLNSSLFTSTSDLAPVSQFVNGWTADLYMTGLAPANNTTKYAFGTIPSGPNLSFPVVRPGYDATGGATTVTETVYGTSWLRKPYASETSPTEGTSGGSMLASVALSDYIYNADTPGTATLGSALYTDNVGATSLAGSASVSGTTNVAYPTPIGAWLTEPGVRLDGSQNFTVEFFGGQALGRDGLPLAAVKITLNDGVHNPPIHYATLAPSSRLLSTSCTATAGSNVLTACTSTAGFIAGERITVPGIPGQPKILSVDSSTQMTLGTTGTVTTTLSSSTITVTNNTVPNGDGMGDGLFTGSKINCSTINSGTDATISAEPVTAGVTISSGKATQATWTINTSSTTAGTNTSCTFKHVYQGTTGAVTVTAGNPAPSWQATFTAAEIAALSDGNVWWRAVGYPKVGNVTLDTQSGADGTNTDWQGLGFSVNGTDISPNLHNLFAYKDTVGNYAPRWAWVDGAGVAGASPATQATSADPGSTAYYASIGAACAGLQSYYNGAKGHNTANGGVIIVRSGTQSGLGTSMAACTTKTKPWLTVTYAPADGALTPIIVPGAQVNIGPMTKFLGVTYKPNATNGFTGTDNSVSSAALAVNLMFEQSVIQSTAGGSALFRLGLASFYNSLIDQSAGEVKLLTPQSAASTQAVGMLAGSTAIGGTFTSITEATWTVFNGIGNVTWGQNVSAPTSPSTLFTLTNTYEQATSFVLAYNKLMGMRSAVSFNAGSINNLLMTHNVIEEINNSGQGPTLQISADNNTSPSQNIARTYNTVIGERTNAQYVEGVPASPSACTTTGGALAAGTYMFQVVYALSSAPSVETATDGPGPNNASGVASPLTVASGSAGSCTLIIERDAYHVANVYISAVNTLTPDHLAIATINGATGQTASGVTTGQSITITGIGAAQTPTASLPGRAVLKTGYYFRFNLDQNWNNKTDTYNGSGNNGPNGGRVGNWAGRWWVGDIGNVVLTGSVINGPGPGPTSGLGDIISIYSTYGSALSTVVYKSDRSWGGHSASLLTPALNLGQSNACINTSTTTTPLNRVPAGFAAWPYDIQGRARLNDGTGAAGAYEQGCI